MNNDHEADDGEISEEEWAEIEKLENSPCEFCGSKIIFSATGFYCTKCKKRQPI